MTATDLLALAMQLPRGGPQRCTFCGTSCSRPYSLPDSFTAIDTLAVPGSGYACSGCLFATTATAGQSPDGKPWMWSWVVTRWSATRYALCPMLGGDRVREGRATLGQICVCPPETPYVIALCPAGRTHTLYRCAVGRKGPAVTLNIDGRPVAYLPGDLASRLTLCVSVARAFGVKVARDLLPVPAGRWSPENLALLEEWHTKLRDLLTAAAACLFEAPEKPEDG